MTSSQDSSAAAAAALLIVVFGSFVVQSAELPAQRSAQAAARPAAAQPPAAPLRDGVVAIGVPGQPVASKAVELRVTGHRSAPSIGNRTAAAGREFVVVDTAWKNLVPKKAVNRKKAADRTAGVGSLGFGGGATAQDKAADAADTTLEDVRFDARPLSNLAWLIVDGRVAEPIDAQATTALPGHVGPDAISIPGFEQVVSGGLAFQAPAGARALSLLFLDSVNGHLLVPITGAAPSLSNTLGGAGRANEIVELAVTGATWGDAKAPGASRLIVGLRGISRKEALADVPFGDFGFIQTGQGCIASPDRDAAGLSRPLAPRGRFTPFVPAEGQLAFVVPAGTSDATLLLRVQQGGSIDLPVLGTAKPRWPAPEATVTDGDVLRVLKLPGLAVPPGLPPAAAGTEQIALDLVVENLRAGTGIELQAAQQFRLVGPDEVRIAPSRAGAQVPCRLDGRSVVPAGGSRRFTLVYDVPPGVPLQLEYRGFTVKSELVKVR